MSSAIRIAKPEDAEGLAFVRVSAWKAAYRGLLPNEILDNLDLNKNADRFRERLEGRSEYKAEDWVYEQESQIIGWLSWRPCDDESHQIQIAELAALYVLPDLFGQGIGHALITNFLKKLQELASFDTVQLWVLEKNERAINFYENHGFRDSSERKDLIINGQTLAQELRYERHLETE